MITLTVSQLNRYLKAILEEDGKLKDLYIKAEISNFTLHMASGHMYFSLTDEHATVRAVMFNNYAEHLRFLPEDGMAVVARGSVGVYEKNGTYQVYVTDIQPDGEGARAVAVRQLRDRLEREGLFDPAYKQPLPKLPQRIGVITAEAGAAIGDITQVLSRRYPIATMVFCPAIVQGAGAPASLVSALETLEKMNCDVILIGRGGGSSEDLAAFQDEMLARAIFMAHTPIISAVGHEMDVSICDMVADFRAPTPSAAAELAVPSQEEMKSSLLQWADTLQAHSKNQMEVYQKHLSALGNHAALRYPGYLVERKQERLDFYSKTLYNNVEQSMRGYRQQIAGLALRLESLNPLSILSRGYAAVMKENSPIRSVSALAPKTKVTLLFADGEAGATIQTITPKENTP